MSLRKIVAISALLIFSSQFSWANYAFYRQIVNTCKLYRMPVDEKKMVLTKNDDGSYHFLHTVFGWSAEHLTKEKTGWADVRHVIEYHAEVAEGDLLEITAKLLKIGNKSITVLYEMQNVSKETLAATLKSTSVYFDLEARTAIPITSTMKATAQKYLIET